MFDILNLAFAAGVVASSTQLYASHDYKPPAQRDGIVAVSLHREFYREDGQGKCEFKGVMVPFVQDWDEIRRGGEGGNEILKPADPDSVAGMAFLVNEKVCEGKDPQVMLRAGDKYRLTAGGNFYRKHVVMASDMLSTPVEQRPKWLKQVLDRVNRLALTDETAAQFVRVSEKEISLLQGSVGSNAVEEQMPVP